MALLHKSDDDRTSPFLGRTGPTASVTGAKSREAVEHGSPPPPGRLERERVVRIARRGVPSQSHTTDVPRTFRPESRWPQSCSGYGGLSLARAPRDPRPINPARMSCRDCSLNEVECRWERPRDAIIPLHQGPASGLQLVDFSAPGQVNQDGTGDSSFGAAPSPFSRVERRIDPANRKGAIWTECTSLAAASACPWSECPHIERSRRGEQTM